MTNSNVKHRVSIEMASLKFGWTNQRHARRNLRRDDAGRNGLRLRRNVVPGGAGTSRGRTPRQTLSATTPEAAAPPLFRGIFPAKWWWIASHSTAAWMSRPSSTRAMIRISSCMVSRCRQGAPGSHGWPAPPSHRPMWHRQRHFTTVTTRPAFTSNCTSRTRQGSHKPRAREKTRCLASQSSRKGPFLRHANSPIAKKKAGETHWSSRSLSMRKTSVSWLPPVPGLSGWRQ